jgi:hypothetical protein
MEYKIRKELIAGFVCCFVGKKLQRKLKYDVCFVLSEECLVFNWCNMIKDIYLTLFFHTHARIFKFPQRCNH